MDETRDEGAYSYCLLSLDFGPFGPLSPRVTFQTHFTYERVG